MPCAGCRSLGNGQGHLLEKGLPEEQRSLGPAGTRILDCPHPAEGIPLDPNPRGLYIDYKYIRGKGVDGEGLWVWSLTSPLLFPLVPYPWGRLLKKNKRI